MSLLLLIVHMYRWMVSKTMLLFNSAKKEIRNYDLMFQELVELRDLFLPCEGSEAEIASSNMPRKREGS